MLENLTMKAPTFRSKQNASVLLVAVLVTAILALALASTIFIASNKYHGAFQAASWHEALRAAESGADLAMAGTGNSSWSGCYTVSGSPPPRVLTSPSPASSVSTGLPGSGSYNYTTTTIYHGGEGNTRLSMFVTIDGPSSLRGPSGQWYRIRSTGTADAPSPVEASLDARKSKSMPATEVLRKLMLVFDRNTGSKVTKPQVSRVVEVVAQRSSFQRAITLRNQLVMEDDNSKVDSYDSTDSTKSTNGLYDSTKRQSNGDIAINNSTGSDLHNDYVYGNLLYNGFSIPNSGNVQGTKTPSFTDTIPTVSDPGNGWTATNTSVTKITSGTVLTGGTASAPTRYKVSSINLTSGNATINPNVSGQQSYIEVWVTGDENLTGGNVVQQAGLHVTYYVDGNITLDNGATFDNQSQLPANLQIYGVTPFSGQHLFDIRAPTNLIANVDAPDWNFRFEIQDSAPPPAITFTGSMVGYSLDVHSPSYFHYDEGSGGGKRPYTVASWYEDSR